MGVDKMTVSVNEWLIWGDQHSSCIWLRIILFSNKEVYLYRDAFHNVVRDLTIFSKK